MACISYDNKFPNQGLKTHPDEIGHVQGGMDIDLIDILSDTLIAVKGIQESRDSKTGYKVTAQ